MRPNDVSRFGFIFCQLCKTIINALDAKAGEIDDPLDADTKWPVWMCEACDLEAKRELAHRRDNGHDPATPTL